MAVRQDATKLYNQVLLVLHLCLAAVISITLHLVMLSKHVSNRGDHILLVTHPFSDTPALVACRSAYDHRCARSADWLTASCRLTLAAAAPSG